MLPLPSFYSHISSTLGIWLDWLDILAVYNYLLPDEPLSGLSAQTLIRAFRDIIAELSDRFPVYELSAESTLEEMEATGEIGEVPYLHNFLVFHGFDLERDWEEWGPVFQLLLAVFRFPDDNWFAGIYPEVPAWWQAKAQTFDLPNLDQLDRDAILSRIQDLPEPYNGLYAAYQWLNGTENLWTDVPAIYAHEFDLSEIDWSVECIEKLVRDWRRAESQVIDPALDLDNAVKAKPDLFRTCIDLCLGRTRAIVQDGELIIDGDTFNEPEPSL